MKGENRVEISVSYPPSILSQYIIPFQLTQSKLSCHVTHCQHSHEESKLWSKYQSS
ncbi:hypothetical protein SS1G_08886 [Sclerotinia sclerotiorum 1980 UF-70]|uniref:Uncharacterized protein n=1 Tax=Sclerotinia sclerotiorum (strain ATCC 18683 / 1980 / Ss-1) TaxID=665079 RepID=A7EU79_SCLS1|nr:hypothetical protein SS1G_08886 [Sclerotinia sclerotiorum 1980 UF-70]EDN93021.1 hypothetical protein SS1G_08886 [Sclerotinia sclerotiorum 1980 UF-70]